MGADSVLDRKLVQVKLASDRGELLLGRLVEPDPGEPALLAGGLAGVLHGRRSLFPAPVHIDGAIDDHRYIIRGAKKPLYLDSLCKS